MRRLPGMASRVFLHIGVMKSATTYIQQLCNANARTLRRHGVLWQPSRKYHQAILDLTAPGRLEPIHRGAWNRLCEAVAEHPGDALVSCERMASLSPQKIQEIAEGLLAEELRVIVTARDLVRVAPSQWQESLKNQGRLRWADWLEHVCRGPGAQDVAVGFWKQQNLPAVVRAWGDVASRGQVHLVTVPLVRSDPDIVWRRFAEAIEFPPDLVEVPALGNPSLGAVSAELLRRLNETMGPIEPGSYSRGFKEGLAKQVLVSRADVEPRPRLDEKSHARLRELSLEMVAELKGMDVTVSGDLADLIPDEGRGVAHDPSDSTDGELLDAAITGLVGLGQRVSEQVDEIRRLRRQLKTMTATRPPAQPSTRATEASLRTRAQRRARGLGRRLRGL